MDIVYQAVPVKFRYLIWLNIVSNICITRDLRKLE